MTEAGVGALSWLHFIFACATVISLMALLGFALKYIRLRGLNAAPTRGRRLRVVESLALDMRRRLVIVRCDEAEHLLLLGHEEDIVVEANLDKTPLPAFKGKNVA
ncbi:MAG TPA: flagellar biosynthetic protein FliO [Alphaproteobacteria bacterium]|nr:flagellar biosynthetic protein FliO [Alphaproteobacteria bacterium]